jgi:hypothetical protein
MHLLRCVVKYTVRDSPLNVQRSCSKCPPSAWIPFLPREHVTLRSTVALLMLLATLRICWRSFSLAFPLCGPLRWKNITNHTVWVLELIQRHNSNRLHMSTGSRCLMRWIWYVYIPSLCVMFARPSELSSVLQGLIPDLILSQKCNSVYVHMGPICNGCWFWNSWSVAARYTRDGVNNTRNSHLWDCDNPHGTVESNYQHLFAVNVWCGVIGDQLIGPYILPRRLTGNI